MIWYLASCCQGVMSQLQELKVLLVHVLTEEFGSILLSSMVPSKVFQKARLVTF